ncbi:MAG TPA: chloride channel protein [Candidatus Eisenbacteria bacterium]|jgi:H+/Cl- antiporter ClcA|nr:chloride channel protein [Candidatus Eisenbacteria bacterium]
MTRKPPIFKKLYKKLLTHRYGLSLFIYLGAAVLTGLACVLFMRGFEFVYDRRLDAARIGPWCWLTTPVLFLAAIELIRFVAPGADGAGIPQTIFAAKHLTHSNYGKIGELVSFRTMAVKILALFIGLWACASTGREGPTVHIAACLFFGIALFLHRLFKMPLDMRSAVIAGGAAGLAAAFNTPLAGVTFAIEELSADYFVAIKDMVLMAIIVAGLAAKSLTGEYIYFGRLADPAAIPVFMIVAVGVFGGAGGTLFSVALVEGRKRMAAATGWPRLLAIFALAWAVLFLATATGLKGIMGPGNLVAQNYVHGDVENLPALYLVSKAAATLFTYWSGIAGGIFAPCLAMGSAAGALTASWMHEPVAGCAMMGMAAFLAGTIQAPITSFVIIYEMTGHHQMLLPIMLASLIGHMVARLFKARHLYQALAGFYDRMLAA